MNYNKKIKDLITDEKLKKHIRENVISPPYKLDQIIQARKEEKNYLPISSNIQIKTIIEYSRNNDSFGYLRLVQLLGKHVHINNFTKLISGVIFLPLKDTKFFRIIGDLRDEGKQKNKNHHNMCSCDLTSKKKRILLLKTHMDRVLKGSNFKIKRYLDFGCGDCNRTRKYGQLFNLSDRDIYGADIRKWFNYSTDKREKKQINFIELPEFKEKYKIQDNFFSLITIFMVLHHVKDLDFVFRELNRILEMGGYLYITEHNVTNFIDKMLCDIEHSIYGIVYDRNKDYWKQMYSNYYNTYEWDLILTHYGFERTIWPTYYLKLNISSTSEPTKAFYMVYKKVKKI